MLYRDSRFLFLNPHETHKYVYSVGGQYNPHAAILLWRRVGLAWSNDPQSYVGGSVATGSASHARQVKGDDPDKKG